MYARRRVRDGRFAGRRGDLRRGTRPHDRYDRLGRLKRIVFFLDRMILLGCCFQTVNGERSECVCVPLRERSGSLCLVIRLIEKNSGRKIHLSWWWSFGTA